MPYDEVQETRKHAFLATVMAKNNTLRVEAIDPSGVVFQQINKAALH